MTRSFRKISPIYFFIDLMVIAVSFLIPYVWKFNRGVWAWEQ